MELKLIKLKKTKISNLVEKKYINGVVLARDSRRQRS